MNMKKICVYCGSSAGHSPAFLESARGLGEQLAKRDIGLVYGGASIGLMGAVADAVLEHGGQVTGIIPQSLLDREIAHSGLTELQVVNDMHERKQIMAELAQAFIAMPGGFGTLEEMFEALTWNQLDIHQKPCGLLNSNQYYDQLIWFLDHSVAQGFLKVPHRALLVADDDPGGLIDSLTAHW